MIHLIGTAQGAERQLFVDEESSDLAIDPRYGRPTRGAYEKPLPIAEQARILQQAFRVDPRYDHSMLEHPIGDGLEGHFALLDWRAVAPTYGEAVELALTALRGARSRQLTNHRVGVLGTRYLREHERTVAAKHLLREYQHRSTIMLVPGHFGYPTSGRSVRRARVCLAPNQFLFGAFDIACMLLTHPTRLAAHKQLYIDCGGDEYSLDGDERFEQSPSFMYYHQGSALDFTTFRTYYASPFYGVPVGEVPDLLAA